MEKEMNFTIVDPQGMQTLAFLINKGESTESNACTLQKLDCSVEKNGDKLKKTFFFNDIVIDEAKKDVILLTLGSGKAVLNSAVFEDSQFYISKEPAKLEYKMLFSKEPSEYKDIKYTPNFKRPISIVDPEVGDEIKPVLYYDSESNMVKAKIKMQPNKPYIALEVREKM